jgi:anti-repressor protein
MNLQVFNGEFGSIRATKDERGEVWFALVDVCRALDIKNPRDAKTRLTEKGVVTTDTLTNGGIQKITFINEPNLYRLIFQSRKKEAIKFQDWVTEEVLPAIRKTGMYATDEVIEKTLNNPDFLIEILSKFKQVKQEKEKLHAELQKNQPYITYAKQIEASNTSIKIGQWAKIISNKGKVKCGRQKLFEWLRNNHYLTKDNLPYQQYEEKGYFEVRHRIVLLKNGYKPAFTTLITSKGQLALTDKVINSFKNENQTKSKQKTNNNHLTNSTQTG